MGSSIFVRRTVGKLGKDVHRGDDADEVFPLIDHGQVVNPISQHLAGRLGERGLGVDRRHRLARR